MLRSIDLSAVFTKDKYVTTCADNYAESATCNL
jgi:hypothetical protein